MSSSSFLYSIAKLISLKVRENEQAVTDLTAEVAKFKELVATNNRNLIDSWNLLDLISIESKLRKRLVELKVIGPRSTKRVITFGPQTRKLILTGHDSNLLRLDIVCLLPGTFDTVQEVMDELTTKRYVVTKGDTGIEDRFVIEPSTHLPTISYLFGKTTSEDNTSAGAIE